MVSQACYTTGTSDGRRYSRPYPLYFASPPERRFPLSSHDTRALSMADHQLDPDSAPQRKRIAVACGRCRKRKIRCSGDPGQGQPCTNCKNAGAEPCQFLRVASREAPLRHEPAGDFGYSVGDARMYAGRASVTSGMQYTQDLPTLGSSDVLGSYRSGSTYGYTAAASKTYYPAMHAYSPTYPDDFEFGLGVPSSHSVMNPEPVGLLPGHWSSGTRAKAPSFSNMYLDTDASYSSYSGTNMVHRPGHSVSSDSPSFSFSGVAASLPITTAPAPDRLLPNPAGRSSSISGLPYPTTKSPGSGVSTSSASTLADVATAASYAGGFDAYPSSTTSSSLSGHPSSSSRSNSDSYSTAESIFSEQERNLQSQGPAFDMDAYTAEPRRGSGSAHDAGTHHHSSAHHLTTTSYLSDSPASPHAHRHGHSVTASGSGTTHADDRHAAAVASRQ